MADDTVRSKVATVGVRRCAVVHVAGQAALLMSHRDHDTYEVSYREVERIDREPVFIRREAAFAEPRVLRTTPAYERREPVTSADKERVRQAEQRRARKLARQAKGYAAPTGGNPA